MDTQTLRPYVIIKYVILKLCAFYYYNSLHTAGFSLPARCWKPAEICSHSATGAVMRANTGVGNISHPKGVGWYGGQSRADKFRGGNTNYCCAQMYVDGCLSTYFWSYDSNMHISDRNEKCLIS